MIIVGSRLFVRTRVYEWTHKIVKHTVADYLIGKIIGKLGWRETKIHNACQYQGLTEIQTQVRRIQNTFSIPYINIENQNYTPSFQNIQTINNNQLKHTHISITMFTIMIPYNYRTNIMSCFHFILHHFYTIINLVTQKYVLPQISY